MRRGSVGAPFLALALASQVAAVDIGGLVPDFGATTVDGKPFSFAASEKGHAATVVLFLSTICPYSNYYDDLLRDMSTKYGSRGVLFVGVNSSRAESASDIHDHMQRHGHTFPMVRDADQKVAVLFDARRTPEAFLLDREGRLRYRGRIASKISSPDLQNALDSLLEGREVRPSETKAFGCSIERP
jgi:peroxiredoxin